MLINDIEIKKNPWTTNPFDTEVEYDPWEGSVRKPGSDSGSQKPDVRRTVTIVSPDHQGSAVSSGVDVSIVDLRAQSVVIKAAKRFAVDSKTSECQTDQPEGVDFDWDLSDKTDTETQTCPPSRADSVDTEPLDVIIQTDQRIVFQQPSSSGKKVTFNLDTGKEKVVKKRTVSSTSQTVWEVNDKEIQVETEELGPEPAEEESAWSLSRTLESSYLDSGLGLELGESQTPAPTLATSSPPLLDDDMDEPLAFVHKSSVLSRRTPTNKQERSRDIAIQTDSFRDFIQGDQVFKIFFLQIQIQHTIALGSHSEPLPEIKIDFLGDDPFFFEECDDHVQIVSK